MILKPKAMMNKWDKFPARKTRKFAVWVEVAFLIALLRLIQYHVVEPVAAGEYYPDSSMYIDFDSSTILHGYTINARPPVYGMLLDFTEAVFGSYYLEATVAIQILCSALAVFVFTAIMGRLHIRGPWKQLVVLFFGASPAIAGWDHCILIESLSLSLAVFFFYFILRYIQERELWAGITAVFLATVMSFLRPQFQIYLALLAVFCVLKFWLPEKNERKKILILVAFLLCAMGIILSYSALIQKQYSVFSISDALPRQNLKVCIDRGYLDLDDEEVAQFLQEQLSDGADTWKLTDQAVERFGNRRIAKTTKNYFISNFTLYIRDTITVIRDTLKEQFYGYDIPIPELQGTLWGQLTRRIYSVFQPFTIGCVLLISFLEGIVMCVLWVRNKSVPWIHTALFSISISTFFTPYFSTCAEYMRTMVSILPYMYILIALFLNWSADAIGRKASMVKSRGPLEENYE